MSNRLIIYTSGEMLGSCGGWCIGCRNNHKDTDIAMTYGNTLARNEIHIELVACIQAFEKIVIEDFVDIIEINCSNSKIVKVMNNIIDSGKFDESNIRKYDEEIEVNIEYFSYLSALIKKAGKKCLFKIPNKNDIHKAHIDVIARRAILQYEFEVFYSQNSEEPDKNYQLANAGDKVIHYKKKKWYGTEELEKQIVDIDLEKVFVFEDIHINTITIDLNGMLRKVANKRTFEAPIVIRKFEDDRYGLLVGFNKYCAAKIMGIKQIRAIITELDRISFIRKHKIDIF